MQIVLPLGGLFVAGSRGVFMGSAGRCVFRVWAVRTFWSFWPLWTRWRWPASSAATPRWAWWPTVTPLPVNRRGQISVRWEIKQIPCFMKHLHLYWLMNLTRQPAKWLSHLSFLVGVSSFSFSFFKSFNRASAFSFSFFSLSFSRSSFSFSFSYSEGTQ